MITKIGINTIDTAVAPIPNTSRPPLTRTEASVGNCHKSENELSTEAPPATTKINWDLNRLNKSDRNRCEAKEQKG